MVFALACATGSVPPEDEVGTDAPDSGTVGTTDAAKPDRPTGTPDGGSAPPQIDAGQDAGQDAPVDSSNDSGKTDASPSDAAPSVDAPIATGDDCTGTNSAQLSISYDQACDNYYVNSFGSSNPCTPGGSECASLQSGGYTFCCFKPPAGSQCLADYGGAQCIPK